MNIQIQERERTANYFHQAGEEKGGERKVESKRHRLFRHLFAAET